jgi:hypothetical protein
MLKCNITLNCECDRDWVDPIPRAPLIVGRLSRQSYSQVWVIVADVIGISIIGGILLGLTGCSQGEGNQSATNQDESVLSTPSTTSNSDEMLAELRKQNELLAEQVERDKERDAENAKHREREEYIDEIAGAVTQLVDEHQQEIGRAINSAGGSASTRSLYNNLFMELQTLLRTEALPIEDDKVFRATVMETSRIWASRKTGLEIPKLEY